MTKQEFLDRLHRSLAGLPLEDAEERLAFYDEMIDDRMEEGLAEEEAVSSFGAQEEIADQILSEIPLSRLVRERVKPKRALRARFTAHSRQALSQRPTPLHRAFFS